MILERNAEDKTNTDSIHIHRSTLESGSPGAVVGSGRGSLPRCGAPCSRLCTGCGQKQEGHPYGVTLSWSLRSERYSRCSSVGGMSHADTLLRVRCKAATTRRCRSTLAIGHQASMCSSAISMNDARRASSIASLSNACADKGTSRYDHDAEAPAGGASTWRPRYTALEPLYDRRERLEGG